MVVAVRYRTPTSQVAYSALEAGMSVLPIKPDGTKRPAVGGWKKYQQNSPTVEDVEAWFRHPEWGLALVTGKVSGGLIALDFDAAATFSAWLRLVQRDKELHALYQFLAEGYEEQTPKGGRHILFRCPEAFVERRPGNQKLALRSAPPPQGFETLAETREEGGLIIIDPSRGAVHPNGKPYVRLRGSVSMIRTIHAVERERLYASVRNFDEVPEPPKREPPRVLQPQPTLWANQRVSTSGERPGDLFLADPSVTWESLLIGWEISEPRPNSDVYLECFLRHPGKVGPNASCTLNADGTDRLYCFSSSVGLPVGRYFNKFEFYAYWWWGGDFAAAARALVEQGYIPRKEGR